MSGRTPLHLDIEATTACNLKCTMCPRTYKLQDGTFWHSGEIDQDLYRRIVVEAKPASIKFQYLGEPTLNPHLADMIRFAKANGVVDVMFNTNATRLTRDLSRDLILSGVDKVFFSFDSPDPEHYNEIRIGADFHTTLANIVAFHEVRAELGRISPLTRASMVLMKENEHQRQAFLDLMAPIVDVVGFGTYLDHGHQDDEAKRLVPLRKKDRGQGPAFCCPQLWQRMFIHPDGVVTPCCVDSDRTLVMGNVKESTVAEIWNGEAYGKLRNMHAAGRSRDIPTCANCSLARLPVR